MIAGKNKKTQNGIVVSDVMSKTVIVRVDRTKRHALYGKALRCSSRFAVHDEHGQAKNGDKVMIVESRPLSKTKRWRLLRILEKAGEK